MRKTIISAIIIIILFIGAAAFYSTTKRVKNSGNARQNPQSGSVAYYQ